MSSYKYKLAISIVTRNRKEVVEEVLERLLKALYDRKIGIYFFDGSDTDELGKVIKEWQQHGFDNVHYKYYSPQIYLDDLERKGDSCCINDAEYVWLCSDKFVPRKECLDQVLDAVGKGYDIIVYNALQWKGEVSKEYCDKVTFFKDCASKLQMLTVPIYGKTISCEFTKENIQKAVREEKYLEIELIFCAIEKIKDFRAKRLCCQKVDGMLTPLNTGKNIISGHVQNKRTFICFVDKVYNTVNELPSIYDDEKKNVLKSFSCYTWFSLEGFFQLRWKKGYDYKQCLQYWNKWKLVTKVPRMIILCISILPCTVSRILYKRVRKVKQLLGMNVF